MKWWDQMPWSEFFWMLSFMPAFKLSPFTFFKRQFFVPLPFLPLEWYHLHSGFPVGFVVKNLSTMQETQIWSLGWEDPLEKGMAINSSILAWRIPWTEESDGLQSKRLQRVGHGWSDWVHISAFRFWATNILVIEECFFFIGNPVLLRSPFNILESPSVLAPQNVSRLLFRTQGLLSLEYLSRLHILKEFLTSSPKFFL